MASTRKLPAFVGTIQGPPDMARNAKDSVRGRKTRLSNAEKEARDARMRQFLNSLAVYKVAWGSVREPDGLPGFMFAAFMTHDAALCAEMPSLELFSGETL